MTRRDNNAIARGAEVGGLQGNRKLKAIEVMG